MLNFETITSNKTLKPTDDGRVLLVDTAGVTITAPPLTSATPVPPAAPGFVATIVNRSDGAISFAPQGAHQVDGEAPLVIAAGEQVKLLYTKQNDPQAWTVVP